MAVTDTTSELFREIKNLLLSNNILPVEGYEFPQEKVAGFWKDVFEARGIVIFGSGEIPDGVNYKQAEFQLPDDPPPWLNERQQ